MPPETSDRSFALAANKDGRLLASSGDGLIQLWDAESGIALSLPQSSANDSERPAVCFASDGRALFASSRTRGISRWNLTENADRSLTAGPREPLALPTDARPYLTDVSADGNRLAVSYLEQDYASLLPLNSNAPVRINLRGHPHAFQIALSPDGRWAASGARVKGGGRIWDLRSGEAARDLEQGEDAFVAFSPDSQWLLTATARGYQLWRTGTWEKGRRIEPETGAPLQSFAVAISPRGDFLAVQQNGDRRAL